MRHLTKPGIFGIILFTLRPQVSGANSNRIDIKVVDGQRCFTTNGIPDHPTGKFPNRGNPNTISEQQVYVCVTTSPKRKKTPTPIKGTVGIAINGVQFRPNTAGFWDPNARRGHSRRGDRNWSLEIFGARGKLGLDFNNAHVGRGGLYHYHGIAPSLSKTSGSSLVGYAGDGFEMHYLPDGKQSGWVLKEGNRPSGPPGKYDGTYNEDYIYVGGEDRLNQCNGGSLNGIYVYFITDTYPFVPRCLYGEVSIDFNRSRHR
jgi:hypothetical protein